MNRQKTIQVLTEIFRSYGPEILQNRNRFQACLEDLLSDNAYSAERLVLRHAVETSALWPLAKTPRVTAEMAEQAVKQLQSEERMIEEDAVFVVQCVTAARGGNPGVVSPPKPKPKPKPKPAPTPPPTPAPPVSVEEPVSCKFGKSNALFRKRGMVHLYTDKLCFEPNKGKENGWEVAFVDVEKLSTGTAEKWVITLVCMVGYIIEGILGYFKGIWGFSLLCIVILLLFHCEMILSLNQRLTIITRAANGHEPYSYFIDCYSPGDKKRLVSFIRAHWSKK